MEEENQHKYSQTPHFFKIILHDTLQAGKLSFPKSFDRQHGRSLCSSVVYLRVASGDVWEMELHREEDGYMWLHNGWQEFVEFYNIKFGYFLVFGYLGNSEFQVLIFDKTTSEIQYPCKAKNYEENNADVDPCMLSVKPEIEESDVQMATDRAACQINSLNCIVSSNPHKSRNCMGKISGDDDYVNGELETTKSFRPYKSTVKSEAIIRARAFRSPNPHFRILMHSAYVNYKSALYLPGRFIMHHIGQKDCYMILSVPCGRFWTVKCRFRMRGNLPEARIQLGWKTFVQDNNLVAGDVCIFELIDSVKRHFQVTIFRAAKDQNFSNSPDPEESSIDHVVWSEIRECIGRLILLKPPSNHVVKSKMRECIGRQMPPKLSCREEPYFNIPYAAISNHTFKYPSFIVVMTEARLRRCNVPIQSRFLKHLKQRTQMVTLDFGGRLWCVKVCFCQQFRRGILSLGWSKFARENSLEAGDICVFELIKKEEMVLKVSIQKGSA